MTTEKKTMPKKAGQKKTEQKKTEQKKSLPQKTENEREIALDILVEILEKGAFSHVVLNQALSKYQYLTKQERSFITRTVEGTLENKIQLDYVLDSCSTIKTAKMKPLIRTLLRMSVYQILYMDRVPDPAVCNEAVKLAVKRRFAGLKGFVNGVLRRISREKEGFSWPDLSIRYSMPQWILDMWTKDYGKERTEAVLKAFFQEKATTVRCNLKKASREAILKSLESQGVEAECSNEWNHLIYLKKYDYLESLDAFQKGLIQVQDMSSSMVGLAASPEKGSYIIDVCGAPGGKSLHLADLLDHTGMVDVRDVSQQKVDLIEENITRSGYGNIKAKVWDALDRDPQVVGKGDVVIADLPCSGLGIIGRKPEIKYHATPESIEELANLQRRMLSVVQEYVKPGGLLVYSTCTVSRRENEENRKWFLEQFPAFCPEDLTGRLGEAIREETLKEGYAGLLPDRYPCDGFFIALFRKKESQDVIRL